MGRPHSHLQGGGGWDNWSQVATSEFVRKLCETVEAGVEVEVEEPWSQLTLAPTPTELFGIH